MDQSVTKPWNELCNGVVLAELGGYGNGLYCVEHVEGAALVIMGTYVIDSSGNVPYPSDFIFKPDKQNYGEYLKENIQTARGSGAQVAVSAISVTLQETVDFFLLALRVNSRPSPLLTNISMVE